MSRAVGALVAASCVLLAGCQTFAATASPNAVASWPLKKQPSAVGVGSPPPFPSTLSQLTLQATWSDMPRAFTDQPTKVSGADHVDYPSTMNGCDDQRFLVRWRVVDSATKVTASLVDEVGGAEAHAVGTSGWMDSHGCVTPAFEVVPSSGGNTLVDVAVQVQEWVPAP